MKSDLLFRQTRRVVSMWKFALEQIQDIKTEHDNAMEKLLESLSDLELYAKDKGIDLELCHLINSTDYLDAKRVEFYRKKILDHGNALKREIENEN